MITKTVERRHARTHAQTQVARLISCERVTSRDHIVAERHLKGVIDLEKRKEVASKLGIRVTAVANLGWASSRSGRRAGCDPDDFLRAALAPPRSQIVATSPASGPSSLDHKLKELFGITTAKKACERHAGLMMAGLRPAPRGHPPGSLHDHMLAGD